MRINRPRGKQWLVEHTVLLLSTTKWGLLGAGAGLCVGLATGFFLFLLNSTLVVVPSKLEPFPPYLLLPFSLPFCVWLIRRYAPDAKGHGTEAVIAAIHKRSGRTEWRVAPIKLVATLITLGTGGSVGKEGPCAQIGASITSFFADLMRLNNSDRRKFVICGVSAGFAAVFGTPISGAIFGIEVLYLGKIEYAVLFPSLMAGIVAHLVCNSAPPLPVLHAGIERINQGWLILIAIGLGILFGVISRLFIGINQAAELYVERFKERPYRVAAIGGLILAALYFLFGAQYSGLGTETIDRVFSNQAHFTLWAFLLKTLATAVTLACGGSGGIITPLFFVGATSGAAFAWLFGLPQGLISSFGFLALLGSATNTPLAAAVMAMEILPGQTGVYAALCTCTAYLITGHHSVYSSQWLGASKSGAFNMPTDVSLGELTIGAFQLSEESTLGRWKSGFLSKFAKSKQSNSE